MPFLTEADGVDCEYLKREYFSFQKNNLRMLEAMRSPSTGFYEDWLTVDGERSDYTVLPNISLGMFREIIACFAGDISEAEAEKRIFQTLSTFHKFDEQSCQGFFPTYYKTDSGIPLHDKKQISVVDNVYLFLTNLVIAETFPGLRKMAQDMNDKMNFDFFLDKNKGLLHGTFLPAENRFMRYHIGALASETRLVDYVYAIQTGAFGHLANLYKRIPENYRDVAENINFHVSEKNRPYLQTNGGNIFENSFPAVFIPEEEYAAIWERQHKLMIAAQKEFGEINLDGIWGHIPCDNPNFYHPEEKDPYKKYAYVVAGIQDIAANSAHVIPHIISPYAGFVVTRFDPIGVLANASAIKAKFPQAYIEGKGFVDALDFRSGAISHRFLSSNIGMAMLGIDSYLTRNILNITSKFFLPLFKSEL